jgi:hypothetical protein
MPDRASPTPPKRPSYPSPVLFVAVTVFSFGLFAYIVRKQKEAPSHEVPNKTYRNY